MAKLSVKNRDKKRRLIVEKYKLRRAALFEVLQDPRAADEAKEEARVKLQKLPRDASPVRLRKITVNMGVGETTTDKKILDNAVADMTKIAGQKPVVTKARKSIANFKVRANFPVGCMVTLRGARMYEFFDRLVNIAITTTARTDDEAKALLSAFRFPFKH